MNKHIDIIRTNTDDMVVLAECNLLEKEIKELQERINKAIEYIEKDNFNCKNQEEQIKFKTDLLNILRGEDNEN